MLARQAKGAIVNVSSQASTVGLPDHTAYCVSKGASNFTSQELCGILERGSVMFKASREPLLFVLVQGPWIS